MILVNGKFSFSKKSVILGVPARLIGAIFVAWLPLALGTGLVIGFVNAMSNPNQPPADLVAAMAKYWWVDIVIALVVIATVVAIAAMSKKVPVDSLQDHSFDGGANAPMAPNSDNPYEPPRQQ